jgi:hypothetical protein
MPDDCLLWTGAVSQNGYGNAWHRGHNTSAHRSTWEQVNGPVPDGIFVCHTCDNPLCINIEHLFLGTPKQNTQDMIKKGRAIGNSYGSKTHCKHGHEFTPENTYCHNGRRSCIECRNRRSRDHYRKTHGLSITLTSPT